MVLIAVYIFMERGSGGVTLDRLSEIVEKGDVSEGRMNFAVSELLEIGFIELRKTSDDATVSVDITHKGARWMEANFRIVRGERFKFIARKKSVVLRDVGRLVETGQHGQVAPARNIDWSKWGAIAGLIALPLALFIWWFS